MEKAKKEFEEYRMDLIYLNEDIICTSPGPNSPGGSDKWDDPVNPGPEGPDGPDIFD